MTIRVLIVDDHSVVRSGLRALLDDDSTLCVVGETATGEEALVLAGVVHPDVVLCDLRLGDGIDGIETTAALRALTPPPAVLILTTFDRDAEILGAIEAGAVGYLLKESAPDAIIDALHRAAEGEMVLSPSLASRVVRGMTRATPKLTEREHAVLKQLVSGASNQEIARSLFVTEATVKTHLTHIFMKLGVGSRSKAILVAQQSGLI